MSICMCVYPCVCAALSVRARPGAAPALPCPARALPVPLLPAPRRPCRAVLEVRCAGLGVYNFKRGLPAAASISICQGARGLYIRARGRAAATPPPGSQRLGPARPRRAPPHARQPPPVPPPARDPLAPLPHGSAGRRGTLPGRPGRLGAAGGRPLLAAARRGAPGAAGRAAGGGAGGRRRGGSGGGGSGGGRGPGALAGHPEEAAALLPHRLPPADPARRQRARHPPGPQPLR